MKNLTLCHQKNALSNIMSEKEQAIAIVSKHYFELATINMDDQESEKVMRQAKQKALFQVRGWRLFKLIPYIENLK